MLEAIALGKQLANKKITCSYAETNRSGDHIWYISDVSKFQLHYPDWGYQYNLEAILKEMYKAQMSRLSL